jgi:hypothetical protein
MRRTCAVISTVGRSLNMSSFLPNSSSARFAAAASRPAAFETLNPQGQPHPLQLQMKQICQKWLILAKKLIKRSESAFTGTNLPML